MLVFFVTIFLNIIFTTQNSKCIIALKGKLKIAANNSGSDNFDVILRDCKKKIKTKGYFYEDSINVKCVCEKSMNKKLFCFHRKDKMFKVLCLGCLYNNNEIELIKKNDIYWSYTLMGYVNPENNETTYGILFFDVSIIESKTNLEFASFKIITNNKRIFYNLMNFDIVEVFINTNLYSFQLYNNNHYFTRNYQKNLSVLQVNQEVCKYKRIQIARRKLDKKTISVSTIYYTNKKKINSIHIVLSTVIIEMKYYSNILKYAYIENIILEDPERITLEIDKLIRQIFKKACSIKTYVNTAYYDFTLKKYQNIFKIYIYTTSLNVCISNYKKILELIILYLFSQDRRIKLEYPWELIKNKMQIGTFSYLILNQVNVISNIEIYGMIISIDDLPSVFYRKKECKDFFAKFNSVDVFYKNNFYSIVNSFELIYESLYAIDTCAF